MCHRLALIPTQYLRALRGKELAKSWAVRICTNLKALNTTTFLCRLSFAYQYKVLLWLPLLGRKSHGQLGPPKLDAQLERLCKPSGSKIVQSKSRHHIPPYSTSVHRHTLRLFDAILFFFLRQTGGYISCSNCRKRFA